MERASGGGYSYSNLYAERDQLMVDSSKLVTREDGSPAVKMQGVSKPNKTKVQEYIN
jgi:hypothetical protein